jgi:hypothetical protein
MRVPHVIPLALALFLFAGCMCNRVPGSGKLAEEARKLDDFRAIEAAGSWRILIEVDPKVGASPAVAVSGDDNLVPLVRTRVSGGALKVDTDHKGWLAPKIPLTLRVRVADLERVETAGSANVTIGGVSNDALRIECAGSADVTVSGRTDALTIEVAGSADVEARALVAGAARIEIAGSGEATVHVTERLDVDIAGSGKVYVHGKPKHVQQDIAGSGKLITRD